MSSVFDQLIEMGFSQEKACNKCLRDDAEVQLHSARTGHVKYSESLEEVKPLTDEEKEKQMEKLQELLKLKRSQREEQDKQAEILREKQRRTQGKNLGSAKAKFQEDEIHRMVEERKREKEEDRLYKEKLKAEIAMERKEKRNRELGIIGDAPSKPVSVSVAPSSTMSDHTVCRLQIRFPSGSPVISEFKPDDTLGKVVSYVQENWENLFGANESNRLQLFTNFPRRDFSQEDEKSTLFELGLHPSAVLLVRQLPLVA